MPARADLDVSDYAAATGKATGIERQRLARSIASEQKEEAEREAALAELAAAAVRAEQARLAARPYPERLTEARCTRCHAPDHYLKHRYSWLGWWLVTLRMKYLNGATDITEAERMEIAAHLASILGGSAQEAVIEYLTGALLCGALLSAGWMASGARRSTNKKSPAKLAGSDGGSDAN